MTIAQPQLTILMACTVLYVYLMNDLREDIVIILFEILITGSITNFQYMLKA